MKINLTLWNEARLNLERALKAQKQLIRHESDGHADWTAWRTLRNLKADATRLYAIRATSHGKEHAGQQAAPAEFAS